MSSTFDLRLLRFKDGWLTCEEDMKRDGMEVHDLRNGIMAFAFSLECMGRCKDTDMGFEMAFLMNYDVATTNETGMLLFFALLLRKMKYGRD